MTSRLLRDINAHFLDTAGITGVSRLSEPVREALRAIDRAAFIPASQRPCAELDSALPIGCGQTISQPFIVALMTELLQPRPGDKVLEIGTGSGYQAAVLSRLVKQVYSIEVVPALANESERRLKNLGFENVAVACGDGYHGWPEQAPFDGIIITAAIEKIPDSLVEQLAEGGRMVLPIGDPGWGQQLTLVEKLPEGLAVKDILAVRFVPFVHGD